MTTPLKDLLEQRFPYGSTEHHYVSNLTVTVSTEGLLEFAKKLFQRKKLKVKEEGIDTHSIKSEAWEWLTQVLAKQDHRTLTLKPGTVEVPGLYAGFFMRHGKPVENVTVELQRDIKEYRQLLAKYKTRLQAAGKFLNQAQKELDDFNDEDTDDLEHQDQLEALLEKLIKACPPSLVDGFQEPTYKFLGFEHSKFLDKEDGRAVFATGDKPDKASAVSITFEDEKQVGAFLTAVKDAFQLSVELMNLTESVGVVIDPSDPPLRGYYSDLPRDLTKRLRFVYPTFDEEVTGLAWALDSRTSWLVEAMAVVGRKLIEKTPS